MDHFRPVRGVLHAEGVALERLAARMGTPTYVYSEATLRRHFRVVDQAFGGAQLILNLPIGWAAGSDPRKDGHAAGR